MELLIVSVAASMILFILVAVAPTEEPGRQSIHTMVGADPQARRQRRVSVSAQVAERPAPRPLKVRHGQARQMAVAQPVADITQPISPAGADWGPLQLPKPAAVAPRLDWARQTSESSRRYQGERYADSLVASLVSPTQAS